MPAKTQEIIVLPTLLENPAYVSGLDQPLELVADALDQDGKHEFALALRNAATICKTFAKVIAGTHIVYTKKP